MLAQSSLCFSTSRLMKTSPGLLIVGALLLSFGHVTLAQSLEQEEDADPEQSYEVVIVTAQKRAQNLTDVPIALSSFSKQNVEQTGITQLTELADYIPNLQISRATDFTSSITIRGVGANSRNIGFDTRVGVYLDGVYLGQSPALNQELLDLSRIEVLRGPQGTLFGKNTVAGAINLISQKPGDTFAGEISASVGNFNAREIQGLLNIPLSQSTAAKFSLSKLDRDGYILNLNTGHKLNERDSLAYRGQLRSEISDKLELNFSVDGLNTERLSILGEALSDTLGNTVDKGAPNKNEVAVTIDSSEKRDIYGTALDLAYQLDSGYQLKSITAYRDTDILYRNDPDYAVVDLLQIEYSDQYQQWTQELQLISPERSDTFNYVAGLYYYFQQADTRRDAINGEQSFIFGNVPGTIIRNSGEVTTRSYAAFINGAYELSAKTALTLGLRYTDETKDVDWLLDGSSSGIFRIGSTDGELQDKRSDTDLSYSVSVNYRIDPRLNSYAKYSTGFKSGGYNLDYVTNADLSAGIAFDKETVGSTEVGLKGNFFANKLIANFAAFYSEFDDYQVNQFIDLGNGASSISIRNAAQASTQGLELEVIYRPLKQLEIQASAGLLDTEFDDFPGGLSNGSNAKGKHLINAPKANYSLSVQYLSELTSLSADLLLRADITNNQGFYTSVDNVKTQTLRDGTIVNYGYVESLSMLNARIGLQAENGLWEAYIWGRNLTDETDPIDSRKDFFGTVTVNYNEPRTYGAEVVYHF
jgi:iron complex outermembrane recepter protein